MIAPLPRGKAIDGKRFSKWKSLFSGYKHQINEVTINCWLNQFQKAHRDTAARLLDCVDFVTHAQMVTAFRETMKGLPGWKHNPSQLKGRWRFVALSLSAGESGDAMLHKFRVATGLNNNTFKEFFPYKSDLLKQNLSPQDTVVFVDDFSGTGSQVCEAWEDNIREILPNEPQIFLLLVAASTFARKRILKETGLIPIPYKELTDKDNIFSDRNHHFDQNEKSNLLKYCVNADKKNPRGFGDSGLVIVFSHGCPNNSIPILHASNSKWTGLFPRSD